MSKPWHMSCTLQGWNLGIAVMVVFAKSLANGKSRDLTSGTTDYPAPYHQRFCKAFTSFACYRKLYTMRGAT